MPRPIRTCPALAAALAAASLWSCGRGQQVERESSSTLDPASAVALMSDGSVRPPPSSTPSWAKTEPLDLSALIDRADPASRGSIVVTPEPVLPAPEPTLTPDLVAESTEAEVKPPRDPEPEMPPIPVAPPKSLDEQVQEAALVLMGLMAQQTSERETAWRAYLGLAALDLIRPGSMPNVISPDLKGAAILTPEELATAETVRKFLADLAGIPGDASPQARSARISEFAEQIASAAPMRIVDAALCSRVTGFAQYVPLGGDRFLQGRPQRAIVYVEVANFGHMPVSEGQGEKGDQWAVRLSQALQLYHDADGTLAWSRPEEEIMETSRRRRRDFYLVTDITFPPTLTIGAYRLKIVLRDRATGQVDERTIPIQVVADPALALQPGSSGR